MNDLTLDLAQLIVDAGIAKALDDDIFYDYMPKEIDNLISINEYAGSPTAMYTDTNVRSVQITVRNRSNQQAKEIAWKVFDRLNTHSSIIQIGKVTALINLRNSPFRLNADDMGRHRWVFNCGITYNYK